MSLTISARDANQRFAEILGKAAAGETVIITRRGEPVAQLTSYRPEAASPERRASWDQLLAWLDSGVTVGVPEAEIRAWKFDRDEAHER
jgi:prevent-host-death family protein